ncbi:MAG: alpha-L-rhamnosidase, partial [Deltaproteobacteria bacterium]
MLFAVAAVLCPASVFAQAMGVANLKCEYQRQPLGVQQSHPSLSWEITSGQRNTAQIAYQVLVAQSLKQLAQNLGEVWNSGKVTSGASIQVRYAGQALQPAHTYYWKVKTWDNHGGASAWSAPAQWQMGLLAPADWRGARWIAYEPLPAERVNVLPVDGAKDTYRDNNTLPLLRKSFSTKKQPTKATLFISGLGQFEAVLN